MASNPKLSILLSTRNHSQWLSSCLVAITRQTFKDFEFLIFDDGSTDATPKILKTWSLFDNRITIIPFIQGNSLMEKYMYLASLAKGEFLWFVASDDYVHDINFLKKGFSSISKYFGIAGFFSNARRVLAIDSQWDGNWGWYGLPRLLKPRTAIKKYLKGSLVIPGAASVVKKKYFFRFGGYKKEAGHLGDLLNLLLLAQNYGLFYLGSTSVTVRVFKKKSNYGSKGSLKNILLRLSFFESTLQKETQKARIYADWTRWRSKMLACCFGRYCYNLARIEKYILQNFKAYNNMLSNSGISISNESIHIKMIFNYMRPNYCSRFLTRIYRSVLKRIDFLSFSKNFLFNFLKVAIWCNRN